MPVFTFDVKLFATFRVEAETEELARQTLGFADFNATVAPLSGDVCTSEASMDGDADLVEIDGEAV